MEKVTGSEWTDWAGFVQLETWDLKLAQSPETSPVRSGPVCWPLAVSR